ncbi:iron-containing alcohol dehydrogenase family protein [Desulfatiferula olefinivorans]
MDFSYLMPTRVLFGRGCVVRHGDDWAGFSRRVLIVTGRRSARACGALSDVCSVLDRLRVPFELYDRIQPNPTVDNVRDAASLARSHRADGVIGIGGGSPMDAAKAVALLATNDPDDAALFSGPYPHAPLPVLAVPTTAGTGSEVTPYAILTDEADQTKKNLAHPGLFPRVALLDPRYLEALPRPVMIHTALDALSHAVESLLSARNREMSALAALAAIDAVGPALTVLAGGDTPDEAGLERLLYGSMLAGTAIAQTGTTMVHAMGYSLTFFQGVDHGKANAVLLCEAMKFCEAANRDMIQTILNRLGVRTIDDLQAMFDRLIGRLEPLPDDRTALFTEKAMATRSIDNTVPRPTADDISALYQRALGRSDRS